MNNQSKVLTDASGQAQHRFQGFYMGMGGQVFMAHSCILVIGNDVNFCYLMQRYIHKSAHRSLLASFGSQLDAIISQERPAAIILEVTSPESEAWKILDDLKAHPALREIPTVICSWQDVRNWAEKGNAFLHMPVLYEEFSRVLQEIGLESTK